MDPQYRYAVPFPTWARSAISAMVMPAPDAAPEDQLAGHCQDARGPARLGPARPGLLRIVLDLPGHRSPPAVLTAAGVPRASCSDEVEAFLPAGAHHAADHRVGQRQLRQSGQGPALADLAFGAPVPTPRRAFRAVPPAHITPGGRASLERQ